MKISILAFSIFLTTSAFAKILPEGNSDMAEALLLSQVQEELTKSNVECKPQLNLTSNILLRAWRDELRIGFNCEEDTGKAKIKGSVLIKEKKIKGCDEASRAKLLAKFDIKPLSEECLVKDGKEFFSVLLIKKMELKFNFF